MDTLLQLNIVGSVIWWTHLNIVPIQICRPDHNLQDIISKVFPSRRKIFKTAEFTPSNALPFKRKERSLSSLVVSTPKVSTQAGMTGRRTKSAVRKPTTLRGSSCGVEELDKKEGDSTEDCPESSRSSEKLNRFLLSKRQSFSSTEPFHHQISRSDSGKDIEPREGNVDLWKPLNFLVEAANRSKTSKLNSQSSYSGKSEPASAADCDILLLKPNVKEHEHVPKDEDDENSSTMLPVSFKHKGLRVNERKRPSEELTASPQALLDAITAKRRRRCCPVWFSLVASADQGGDVPLPQISACYLRIKDGNLPVSFIQKYLVRKLDLTSETEVEITCQGQPLLPTSQVQNLVDLWSRKASKPKRVTTSVGSSAKDFVMVLSYARRTQAP
ncbi:hypothetical protein RJ639_044323 [Escallonia herrerae]|uniref:E3 ubiquitin protein ligase DRIP2 n=1 Tax=Escallonia herrerae TaxID=1293975 RepID=A0AA88WBH3_9ASTE|nr:hypothetical protein RJ639_044323 [Escallonia herrerae]